MSGGSYEYVCFKFEEFGESLRKQESDPRRAAFGKLIKLVAKAAHDIEWVDSCDYASGEENKAIDEVFNFLKSNPETIAKAHAFDGLKDRMLEYFKEH